MTALECDIQRVFDGTSWDSVCRVHSHPERSIKASEMDDEGVLKLFRAICAGFSVGTQVKIAEEFGLLDKLKPADISRLIAKASESK